ncbi:MAG: hypothetical protein AAGA56_07755 [Myxococcota bacterium]
MMCSNNSFAEPSLVAFVIAGALIACSADPGSAPPSVESSRAAAPPSPSVSTSAVAPQNRWAGQWRGTFEVTLGTVTVPSAVPYPAWKQDADVEPAETGDSTLTLDIDGAGRVTGTLRGALGPLAADGLVDDKDTLRVGFSPPPGDRETAYRGFLVAPATGTEEGTRPGFAGRIVVSDGRGLRVRQAEVRLAQSRADK